MPTTPVARPSSPSTKFTALIVATTTNAGEQGALRRVEGELAAVAGSGSR